MSVLLIMLVAFLPQKSYYSQRCYVGGTMKTTKKKTKRPARKTTTKNKALKQVYMELHSDIDYLRFIITCQEPQETKEDMLFSLHNCLSNRTQKLSEVIWE